MKFNYKHLLILFLILASLYVNYMVFISFRLQNIIRYDINNKKLTLTDIQIESLSNQIPNIIKRIEQLKNIDKWIKYKNYLAERYKEKLNV